MLKQVKFISTYGSQRTGETPVFTLASYEPSSSVVATFGSVKVSEDLDQIITVPYFAGYMNCNLVRMNETDGTGSPEYYWITDIRSNTFADRSITFSISYNPITTLSAGSSTATLKGIWDRRPTATAIHIQDNMFSGDFAMTRRVTGGYLNPIDTDNGKYFVQITSTANLNANGTVSDTSSLIRYGMFVAWDKNTMFQNSVNVVPASGSTAGQGYYPNLAQIIMNSDTLLKLPADSIIDISISAICPFGNIITFDSSGTATNLTNTSDAIVYPNIKYGTGLCIYKIDDSTLALKQNTGSFMLTLGDSERAMGSVNVTNSLGDVIGNVPTAWFDTIQTIRVRCYSDYTGLYSVLYLDGHEDKRYIFNEGKVPWIGDSWNQYKIRSMDADRQALQRSIDSANESMMNGIASSAANNIGMGTLGGLMSGKGPAGIAVGAITGVAATALEAWERSEATKTAIRDLQSAQEVTEKRAKCEAGTSYNLTYGISYVLSNIYAGLNIYMPVGYTQAKYNDFTAEKGYPAEGVDTVTVSQGYLQGRVFADGTTLKGLKFNRLNEVITKGVRIKVIQ